MAASLLSYGHMAATLLAFNHASALLLLYIPMAATVLPFDHITATLLTMWVRFPHYTVLGRVLHLVRSQKPCVRQDLQPLSTYLYFHC